jgi:bacterial outer membrane protein
MKKIFLSTMLAGAAIAANAQSVSSISNSKFFDNWQVGVNVGGYTPTTGYPFFKSTRLNFGVEVGKQISPSFRLSADGVAYINNNVAGYRNPLVIERTNVAMLGNFNLSNIFAGYKGAPRTFEVEAFAGPGWFHSYNPGRNDSNEMTVKFGANFLLNLGASKAWAIKLSPSILYALTPTDQQDHSLNNNASLTQASLGIVYRFKGSNGAHHITAAQAPAAPVVEDKSGPLREELRDARKRIHELEEELAEARNRKPEVVETKVVETKRTLESVVTFAQGKTIIAPSQQPNVARIATYLRKYPNSKVIIKGFASPEGSIEVNERIAKARAEAVKAVLVKQYKINADRIVAEGNGIGHMFSEPDWNRVSIATIKE